MTNDLSIRNEYKPRFYFRFIVEDLEGNEITSTRSDPLPYYGAGFIVPRTMKDAYMSFAFTIARNAMRDFFMKEEKL